MKEINHMVYYKTSGNFISSKKKNNIFFSRFPTYTYTEQRFFFLQNENASRSFSFWTKAPETHFKDSIIQFLHINKSKLQERSAANKRLQQNIESTQVLRNVQPNQFCLVHINKTKNNIHCVVSNLFGKCKTIWSISGGAPLIHGTSVRSIRPGSLRAQGNINSTKTSGCFRKTRYTQRMVYSAAIEKMLGLGFQYLVLHFKGATPSKRHVLKAFSEYFTIILFKDHTSVMHNGCRPRKMRRI